MGEGEGRVRLGGGGGIVLLLLASLSSVIPFFFTQNKLGGVQALWAPPLDLLLVSVI